MAEAAGWGADVHYVVCTRNNVGIIGETLQAIAGQTTAVTRCSVIDGCSSDGTREFIGEHFPWVEVITKETDSGPAASRSIGLTLSKSDYVVLLDSDVRLQPEWTARQLDFLTQRPQAGMVGGKLVYEDAPDTLDVAYGGMNRLGIAWDAGRGEPAGNHARCHPCLWLSTSAIMLRRQTIGDVGDFDSTMFAYHEDVDYGWRANLAGWQVLYNPEACARHLGHATLGDRSVDPRITYLLWRNRLRSLLVNYQLHNLLTYGLLHLLAVGYAIVTRKARREILRGLVWNVTHIKDTLRRRRDVQARRRLPDSALYPLLSSHLRGPSV